jgi:hypothetical protein
MELKGSNEEEKDKQIEEKIKNINQISKLMMGTTKNPLTKN